MTRSMLSASWLVMLFLILMTGCAKLPSAAVDGVPALEDGVLTVATAITPPFESYDPVTSELTGFDIDLATLIAESFGVSIEWRVMAFADLIPALEEDEVEMVIAAMYVTPEREERVDFSRGYLDTGLVMVIPAGNDFIEDPLSITALRVGVKQGATGERWIDALAEANAGAIEIYRYEETRDSLEDLEAGFIDVVLNDHINSLIYIQSHPELKVGSEIMEGATLGIAVKEGNTSLLDVINQTLSSLEAQGVIDDLYSRWILS